MTDLIQRARDFATHAHQRIDHRRKYSGQPYEMHLAAVAALVASVTDDPETIAAAWLHDVVEDTTVTFDDLRRAFGTPVQQLVEELTDTSRPSQGNRAARKDIDRRHLGAASPRGQTVKLADLIDNCDDITRHDQRFARVYLQEMEALLAVLVRGDARLMQRARRLHADCLQRLQPGDKAVPAEPRLPAPAPTPDLQGLVQQLAHPRLVGAFREMFRACDIFDPLLCFDTSQPAASVAAAMAQQRADVACLCVGGLVQGRVLAADLVALGDAPAGRAVLRFSPGQVLDMGASLIDVVDVLARFDRCFVAAAGAVVGVIARDTVNKPLVRMWLFGAITLFELGMLQLIERSFPGDSWQAAMPPARLEKARELQQERDRRQRPGRLIDCLQFGDKARLVLEHPHAVAALGLESKRAGKQLVKALESLRNHLVHAQDIVSHDWVQIIHITQRMARLGGA